MAIGFDNIYKHVTSLDKFALQWRFTDEMYDKLPDQHLMLVKPLDKEASQFLWDYIMQTNLQKTFLFRKASSAPSTKQTWRAIIKKK